MTTELPVKIFLVNEISVVEKYCRKEIIMKDLINPLSICPLFKGFSENEILCVIQHIHYKITCFSKGQTIAIEEDECSSIGIVMEGSVEIQKVFASGKTITIAQLSNGNIFGEVIIFSDMNRYPSTIVSTQNTRIMFITKEEIINLCSFNHHFLNNFMGLLSSKILLLNRKLKNLSYQTIRQKVSNYILEEYHRQKKLMIALPCSRKAMAEQLGVPRPSLSRELINMREEGLIDFDKNTIKINNLSALEESLYE
ncbi:MAG: hypothetical protein PWQ70_2086 [Clostridiales bacterium]|nr:hypothetical protein [Clostridiales bacterium]